MVKMKGSLILQVIKVRFHMLSFWLNVTQIKLIKAHLNPDLSGSINWELHIIYPVPSSNGGPTDQITSKDTLQKKKEKIGEMHIMR